MKALVANPNLGDRLPNSGRSAAQDESHGDEEQPAFAEHRGRGDSHKDLPVSAARAGLQPRAACSKIPHLYDSNEEAMKELEEGTKLQLDFRKLKKATDACPDIVPVAVQNADSGEVILVAYANELALRTALETGRAVFWSTSRNELWEKGKTSGETFDLLEVRVNCEQNSLLYRVRPRRGGICHTKNRAGAPRNCYYRRLDPETGELGNLDP
jgi:phosphoribosyl-AMP cyclohydrolase